MNSVKLVTCDEYIIDAADYAYFGGFFDGEGCIQYHYSIPCKGRAPTSLFTIQITNTNPEIANTFQSTFHGMIITKAPIKPNYSACYEWRASSLNGFATLEKLTPYLRIKRAQADMMLRYKSFITRRGFRSKQDKLIRLALADRMCLYNGGRVSNLLVLQGVKRSDLERSLDRFLINVASNNYRIMQSDLQDNLLTCLSPRAIPMRGRKRVVPDTNSVTTKPTRA